MRKSLQSRLSSALALVVLMGCGGGTPSAPTPGVAGNPQPPATTTPPTTTLAPAAPATPAPDPSPSTYPNGQTVVSKVIIKVQNVWDKEGNVRKYDANAPVYVGEIVRFDATAKDVYGMPTNGAGDEPRWSWEPDSVMNLNTSVGFNPKGKALSDGGVWLSASLDGVDSEPMYLEVRGR